MLLCTYKEQCSLFSNDALKILSFILIDSVLPTQRRQGSITDFQYFEVWTSTPLKFLSMETFKFTKWMIYRHQWMICFFANQWMICFFVFLKLNFTSSTWKLDQKPQVLTNLWFLLLESILSDISDYFSFQHFLMKCYYLIWLISLNTFSN